jgi:hypothetical protein
MRVCTTTSLVRGYARISDATLAGPILVGREWWHNAKRSSAYFLGKQSCGECHNPSVSHQVTLQIMFYAPDVGLSDGSDTVFRTYILIEAFRKMAASPAEWEVRLYEEPGCVEYARRWEMGGGVDIRGFAKC